MGRGVKKKKGGGGESSQVFGYDWPLAWLARLPYLAWLTSLACVAALTGWPGLPGWLAWLVGLAGNGVLSGLVGMAFLSGTLPTYEYRRAWLAWPSCMRLWLRDHRFYLRGFLF